MRFFFTLVLSLCFLSLLGLLNTASRPNSFLHRTCKSQVPQEMQSQKLLQSLVCGENLQDMQLKKLLTDSSLIHLIVVSGSHFLVLIWLLKCLRLTHWLQLILLLLYWLMTQAQAPGLFALLIWGLRQSHGPSFRSHQRVLLAGLFCLLIQPRFFQSGSLYLTWLCCLGLTLASKRKEKLWGDPNILIYIFVNLFGGWTIWSHPLGFILNMTIGAFLSLVFFPLGIFVVLTHQGIRLFDQLTEMLHWLLRNLGPAPIDRDWAWSPNWWGILLILHISLQLSDQTRQQKKVTP